MEEKIEKVRRMFEDVSNTLVLNEDQIKLQPFVKGDRNVGCLFNYSIPLEDSEDMAPKLLISFSSISEESQVFKSEWFEDKEVVNSSDDLETINRVLTIIKTHEIMEIPGQVVLYVKKLLEQGFQFKVMEWTEIQSICDQLPEMVEDKRYYPVILAYNDELDEMFEFVVFG